MAGAFPTLKSGNTIWYPLAETHSFGTGILKFLDDTEQRWRSRNMLRRMKLVCQDINAYDSSLILQFWRSQFGRFDATWSITIGGVNHPNLAFNSDSYQITENKVNRHTLSFDVIQVLPEMPTIPAAKHYFPQINSGGTITALPYTSGYDYRSTISAVATGSQYAWKWRTTPLGKYALNLASITDTELQVVQDFFYSMEGRKGEFSFMDPGGNLVPFSDDYSNASWSRVNCSVGAATDDPYGGNLATTMNVTNPSIESFLHCPIIPAGNATGFILCGSVWARAHAIQNLAIVFLDSGLVVQGFGFSPLVVGQWVRVQFSITLATNNAIRMAVGGQSTWEGASLDLFSAQCSPMPGAGPRMVTPGYDGLRAKCRFDTDDFVIQRARLNDNTILLPIQEYK